MNTSISITLTTVLTGAIKDAVSALSECGIPAGLSTLGPYTRLRGVSDEGITAFMASIGASERLLIIPPLGGEVTVDTIKPLVLGVFDKLKSGELTCIHMQESGYQILIEQPEWIAAQPEYVA